MPRIINPDGLKSDNFRRVNLLILAELIIRYGIKSSKKDPSSIPSERQESSVQVQSLTVDKEEETNKIQSNRLTVTSIADELSKLAKLRDQGVITEAEFVKMKGNLINGT